MRESLRSAVDGAWRRRLPGFEPTEEIFGSWSIEVVYAAYERAIAAGTAATAPAMDVFWGDRLGMLTDPFRQGVAARNPRRGAHAR